MNLRNLLYLTITLWFPLGFYIETPVLHSYDNLDPSLNYAEPFRRFKVTSQTDLDLSLPASNFMEIVQENGGVLQPDSPLAASSPEEVTTSEPEEERWSSFFPIWGEEARKKGHALPLPFGISGNFFFANRDIDVDSIDIDIRTVSLSLDRLVSAVVESEEMNWSVRFDTWILPFFNIYLL
jgi:hypothetical protein